MNLLVLVLLAQLSTTKRATCTLENHTQILVHSNGASEEIDDWYVRCKVTIGDKVKSDENLPLAHPTEFPEAAAAARDFVKKNK
jgi:hypothetical protein